MRMGMSIMMVFVNVQLVISVIFIFWAREEVIFGDRVVPKYIFDMARALTFLSFAVFWE